MNRHFPTPLFVLPIAVVVCGGCWSYSFTTGRSVTTVGSGSNQEITVKVVDGLTRTEIHGKGRIELSTDDRDIVSVTSGGHLRIRAQTSAGTREIEAVAGEAGEINVKYQVDGSPAELDVAGQEWLAKMLDFVVHETPIGAAPRAERFLRDSGPAGLIDEVQHLKSGSAQEIYFQVLLRGRELSPDELISAAQVAAKHVSSNSTLSDVLSEISVHEVESDELSLALIEASEAISSNSRRKDVFQRIAQERPLTASTAITAIQSAAEINSNSSKLDALIDILSAAPGETDVFLAYIQAAQTSSSASRQCDALTTLLAKDALDGEVLSRVAQAAGKITSSSRQEEVLRELIRVAPNDEQVLAACLEAVAQISSTSSQREVLKALLGRSDLSKTTLDQASDLIKGITSTSTREQLQRIVIERLSE